MDQAAARDGRGRFQAGRSGNPRGRPLGSVNKATTLRRLMRDGEDEAATRVVIERATGGDQVAARFLVQRLQPRTRPLPLALVSGASVPEAYEAVFDAVAAATISPEEAFAMARFLDRLRPARAETAAALAAREAEEERAAWRADETAELRVALGEAKAALQLARDEIARMQAELAQAKRVPRAPAAGAAPGGDLYSACSLQADGAPAPAVPKPPPATPTRSRRAYWNGKRRRAPPCSAWGA